MRTQARLVGPSRGYLTFAEFEMAGEKRVRLGWWPVHNHLTKHVDISDLPSSYNRPVGLPT